ncbi:MAG: diguanylate cyclase [Halomonas sp.]
MRLEDYDEADGKKCWLDREEVDRLLNKTQTTQQSIALMLMVRCGLRRAEVVDVTPPDVVKTDVGPRVRVTHGKGDKYREVPVPGDLKTTIDVVAEQREEPADAPIVGCSTRTIQRWVTRAAERMAYLAGAIGLVFTDVISLSLTFPVFDLLLAITLPSMLVLALMRFQRLGIEQRLLVISFTLFAPLLFADMLVAHGFIAWRAIPLSYGSLGFTLAIAAVSLWHYRRTQQQLALANQTLEDKVALRTAELDHLVHKFEGLSLQDSLTGLSNRRHLNSLLEHEVQRAERQGTQLAVLMLDLDYFKRINDTFGHAAGDAVLVDMARFLKNSFRTIDAVCRLGGEEFVVLLPGCSTSDASERVRSLMAALHEKPFHFEGKALGRITLSCGIAICPDHARTADQLLQNADAALYQAKRAGRDRYVIWSG